MRVIPIQILQQFTPPDLKNVILPSSDFRMYLNYNLNIPHIRLLQNKDSHRQGFNNQNTDQVADDFLTGTPNNKL